MKKLYIIKSFWRYTIFIIVFLFFTSLFVCLFKTYTDLGYIESTNFILTIIFGLWVFAREQITNLIFPPLLQLDTWVSKTYSEVDNDGNHYIDCYYTNFNIKNIGRTVAKNIRIKIKDKKNAQWLYLHRPFGIALKKAGEEYINIPSLSLNETDDIVLGFAPKKTIQIDSVESIPADSFYLETLIKANNQIQFINKNETHTFYIQISGDNIKAKCYKLIINNKGFENVEIIID